VLKRQTKLWAGNSSDSNTLAEVLMTKIGG
jgi:hypothetical protein